MKFRLLGSTGISVSEISFGAGPVSGLLTGSDRDRQVAVIGRALSLGVNWFDTAAGYGSGKSESQLGEAFKALKCDLSSVHIATKVRLSVDRQHDLRPLVTQSLAESLQRLQVGQVTLLQVHNSITPGRNDEPTSLTPEDILGPRGVLMALQDLRDAGLVQHFGLTGIGDADSLRTVMQSGQFATIQAPFHLLNPTSLIEQTEGFREPDYRGFLRDAHRLGMGLFAIRAYAAGALLCAPPSAHTMKTPFFPLALYERDLRRAKGLAGLLGSDQALRELALRFVLSQSEFASVILGFGAPEHVDEALRLSDLPPLNLEERETAKMLIKELMSEEAREGLNGAITSRP